MVRDPPAARTDVRNRGIARGRLFMGGLLLFASVIAWAMALWMSPHGDSIAPGTEHVRPVIVTFIRNSAIGTLILSALSGWLLFPPRRPKWPARDYAIIAVLAVMVLSSLYQLIWLYTRVL
jgi:drug/metabolite transporter (DMT)-like permease